jgi:hypothetical protein
MDPTILVVLVVVLALLAVGAVFFMQQRKRTHLRDTFGPEYERAVRETGDRRSAEKELERREERVRQLEIRPLSAEQRARFTHAWRNVQARFVDAPSESITEADRLVTEVMEARGYPMGDFDQRAADISVDHPRVVENYRAARDISLRNRRGEASTEDLRQAMVHYRSLFEDLLETGHTTEHVHDHSEVRIEKVR